MESGDYDTTKLGLEFYDGDVAPDATFQINNKLIIAGFKVNGVAKTRADNEVDQQAEMMHNVWIVARTAAMLVSTIIAGLDGLREKGAEPEPVEEESQVGSQVTRAKNGDEIDDPQVVEIVTLDEEDDEL